MKFHSAFYFIALVCGILSYFEPGFLGLTIVMSAMLIAACMEERP